MSNSNGRITAPVEIKDVQQVLGISEGGNLANLIGKAKTGGRNGWAFATTEAGYNNGSGGLINDSHPYWNIYQQNCPAVWRKISLIVDTFLYKPSFITSQLYGYCLDRFDKYDHNATPLSLTYDKVTQTEGQNYLIKTIEWYVPRFIEDIAIGGYSSSDKQQIYAMLTSMPPDEYAKNPGVNVTIYHAIPYSNIGYQANFEVHIERLPYYNDESKSEIYFVGYWFKYRDNAPTEIQNYQPVARIGSDSSRYRAELTFVGKHDRPVITEWPVSIYKDETQGFTFTFLYATAKVKKINEGGNNLRLTITGYRAAYPDETFLFYYVAGMWIPTTPISTQYKMPQGSAATWTLDFDAAGTLTDVTRFCIAPNVPSPDFQPW